VVDAAEFAVFVTTAQAVSFRRGSRRRDDGALGRGKRSRFREVCLAVMHRVMGRNWGLGADRMCCIDRVEIGNGPRDKT
jgi:hypothetical protein